MKIKWQKMYLDMADRLAEESHAVRLKVGAVFVSPDGVMSTGINGMIAGGTNECEETGYDAECNKVLKTKSDCSHAEMNLFSKMLLQGVSTKGGHIFLSHEPCKECSKMIKSSGVKSVTFRNSYTGSHGTGTAWLNDNNVVCLKEYNLASI